MPLLTLNNINIVFGAETIFEQLDLRIYPHEKIGLVGPNGCGKTTILKAILGQITPDLGEINKRKKLKIAYLPQEPMFTADKTVLEELHAGAEGILSLQKQLEQASHQISVTTGPDQQAAMKKYDNIANEFQLAGGFDYETRIKEITAGLGIHHKYLEMNTNQLSGGQISRLGLAKVLLSDADLLLLDEPTNHLDWDATIWLEGFLANSKAAALIVSHDRYLLNKIVTKIAELRNRKIKTYKGNYTTYLEQKDILDLEQNRLYRQQQEFIAKTRDFVDRNRNKKGMQKVARGRALHLEKLLDNDDALVTKPKYEKTLKFQFAPVDKKSARIETVIDIRQLTKSFEALTLFENLNLQLLTGRKLGIIGPNGAGKSTLLKIILDKLPPTKGSVEIKKNLTLGYLDQAGAQLNATNTVLKEIATILPDESQERLRTILGAFLFSGDDVFKGVSQLSGGERNRLALAKLVVSAPQIMILDEPTNHLDIPSIEALENALRSFTGSLLVVSHDRYFLERIADQLLVIGTDHLGKKHLGTYEYIDGSFEKYAALLAERTAQADKESKLAAKKTKQDNTALKPKKQTPPELKKFNTWPLEKIEQAILDAEDELSELNENFALEEVFTNHIKLTALQSQVDEKKSEINLLYQAYELKM